jgi:hypothetical protein
MGMTSMVGRQLPSESKPHHSYTGAPTFAQTPIHTLLEYTHSSSASQSSMSVVSETARLPLPLGASLTFLAHETSGKLLAAACEQGGVHSVQVWSFKYLAPARSPLIYVCAFNTLIFVPLLLPHSSKTRCTLLYAGFGVQPGSVGAAKFHRG